MTRMDLTPVCRCAHLYTYSCPVPGTVFPVNAAKSTCGPIHIHTKTRTLCTTRLVWAHHKRHTCKGPHPAYPIFLPWPTCAR